MCLSVYILTVFPMCNHYKNLTKRVVLVQDGHHHLIGKKPVLTVI
jgi:hypothetical protein